MTDSYSLTVVVIHCSLHGFIY